MTAKAPTEDEARALLDAEDRELRKVLGDLVFAVDDETMESTVLSLCEARGWTLGVAESLTGGFIGGRIANVPGASAHVPGLDRVVRDRGEARRARRHVGVGRERGRGARDGRGRAACARRRRRDLGHRRRGPRRDGGPAGRHGVLRARDPRGADRGRRPRAAAGRPRAHPTVLDHLGAQPAAGCACSPCRERRSSVARCAGRSSPSCRRPTCSPRSTTRSRRSARSRRRGCHGRARRSGTSPCSSSGRSPTSTRGRGGRAPVARRARVRGGAGRCGRVPVDGPGLGRVGRARRGRRCAGVAGRRRRCGDRAARVSGRASAVHRAPHGRAGPTAVPGGLGARVDRRRPVRPHVGRRARSCCSRATRGRPVRCTARSPTCRSTRVSRTGSAGSRRSARSRWSGRSR